MSQSNGKALFLTDAAGGPWRRSGLVGGGPWAWGVGFERWRDEVRRALAAARSAMKVVAAASVTVGGRRAGRCCLWAPGGWGQMSWRTSSGGRARAAVVAPGLDLGLGLAAGCGRGALTGLGGCLAAVLGFGLVAGVGLVGAWALAAAGLPAVAVGLGARLGGVPHGLGG